MFSNYFTIALRNLVTHKLYSAINILGLSIGLACVIIIALFVEYELSYDKHWSKADRIYRITRTFMPPDGNPELYLATIAPNAALLLKADFPDLKQVVRMWGFQLLVSRNDTRFYESGVKFADPEFFEVFDVPLIEGDPATALKEPFNVILNKSIARKYFGDKNPVGQTLVIENRMPMKVTGIMADLPGNTHMEMNMLASLSTMVQVFGERFLDNWSSNSFHTYILTPEDYNIAELETQIPDFLTRHVAEDANDWTRLPIQRLTDIHLKSRLDNEQRANGSITTVYTFSAIAVFILLIACINFMNLSTARSAQRAREVGMRKVLGAFRQQLVGQFLGESIILGLLSMFIAVALVELLLPWFNNLMGLEIAFDYLGRPAIVLVLVALALVVGSIAGSYPAFYLSAFRPATVLRGELTRGKGGALFRKALVVIQFSISIALLIATGVVFAQMQYAAGKDLGFDRDQVVMVQGAPSTGFGANYDSLKQQLLQHPGVVSVTAANLMPGDQNTNSEGLRAEGNDFRSLPYLNVDYDFFATFNIRFEAGRGFSRDRGTDLFNEPTEDEPKKTGTFVLNRLAASQLGWTPEQAIGKWMEVAGGMEFTTSTKGPIIGVVEDVYFSSLREAVKPLFYRVVPHINPVYQAPNFRQMAIKISGSNIDQTLVDIETTWTSNLPDVPIRLYFLNETFERLYQAEKKQGQLFTLFSALAIFIACLGLFGLASFTTEQRTKEIGIRKAMGGSIVDIVMLLSRDFGYLVVIANVLAWPLAWYLMARWLDNFAYRIDMGVFTFAVAGLLALLIATLTVGGLAARAAWSKPALALRYE